MSNGQSTSNCTAHNYENEKNRNGNAAKGPYNYELFSIMIHSGSASGGHYYAYIKDFRTGDWLCFNDQSVTPVRRTDKLIVLLQSLCALMKIVFTDNSG